MKPGALLLASFLTVKDGDALMPIEELLDIAWSNLLASEDISFEEYSNLYIPSRPPPF